MQQIHGDVLTREAARHEEDLLPAVLGLLDEHRVMAVSTLRPDGWPQTTMVGYVHDGLTIFFAVARTSQKLANILHDNRVSVAIGHQEGKALRGLSMAARAMELAEVTEVEHLNALMKTRYPGESPLAPREGSTAVFRVTPEFISIIDTTRVGGKPRLFRVREGKLQDTLESRAQAFGQTFYRPGAPF